MLRHAARLRLIENEIRAAYNFLNLARLEFGDEHSNAAIQLIAEAEYVADIVDQILSEIPDQFEADRNRLRSEALALKHAIHETHNLRS